MISCESLYQRESGLHVTYRSGFKGQKCKAHRTDGSGPCGAWAIRGGVVCGAHGGRTPHVKFNARARLDGMVAPALVRLRALMEEADSDSVSLKAIENILDRTGYKLPERIEADNAVTIRVEYESAPTQSDARALEEVHTNGKTQHS